MNKFSKLNRFYLAIFIVLGLLAVLIAVVVRTMFSAWHETLEVKVEQTSEVNLDVTSLRSAQQSLVPENVDRLDLGE